MIVGGVLTCALLSAGAGEPESVAAARVYKGKTRQSRSIRIAVSARSLKVLRFKASLRCRDGSILVDDESGFLPTPIRANGRFRDEQVGSTDEVLIRGRRSGRVVRGRLRVRDRLGNGVRCSTAWIKFSARRGR
ncbi:MAG: hypothetical protein ACM3N0_11370 [Chloroflexota bacterium]